MLSELKKTDVASDGIVAYEEKEAGDKQESDSPGLMGGS